MPNHKILLEPILNLYNNLLTLLVSKDFQALGAIDKGVEHRTLPAPCIPECQYDILAINQFQLLENDLQAASNIVQVAG